MNILSSQDGRSGAVLRKVCQDREILMLIRHYHDSKNMSILIIMYVHRYIDNHYISVLLGMY